MDNFYHTYIGKDEKSCPNCNIILSQYEVKTGQCYYCQQELPVNN